MSKSVVVIGCGFAGMEAAFWLKKMDAKNMEVSVIDKSDSMVYTPSLIWLPPRLRTLDEISIKLEPVIAKKGIHFINDEAISIDAENQSVTVAGGQSISYDYLLVAAGWRTKRSHIQGNENILFPCDFPDVLTLTDAIDRMQSGSITFAIEGERPGPGAEFLGLIEYYLRNKGVRDRFNLNLAEEKHKLLIHLGREAGDTIAENFTQRGIHLHLGKNLIAARPGIAVLEGDIEIQSDLICSVGKLEAPELLRKLDFSAKDGFIPVNDDLSCKAYGNIFVAGDAADFGHSNVPKVAHIAIELGQIAAENIRADITGKKRHSFDVRHAFEHLYILPDLGGFAVLARNYKIVETGAIISALKQSIERYYLFTHKLGITWHPFERAAAA